MKIILIAEGDDRAAALRAQLAMFSPRMSIAMTGTQALSEGELPGGDLALIDGGTVVRGTIDSLRLLRGRGFAGPIVVVTAVPDDVSLRAAVESLGASSIARDDGNVIALGTALTAALDDDATLSADLLQARRVFAAGEAALSLQHGINNPLAALLAEAQLLQLEDLTSEQHASAGRMVELCRRIVTLVRRLDALSEG